MPPSESARSAFRLRACCCDSVRSSPALPGANADAEAAEDDGQHGRDDGERQHQLEQREAPLIAAASSLRVSAWCRCRRAARAGRPCLVPARCRRTCPSRSRPPESPRPGPSALAGRRGWSPPRRADRSARAASPPPPCGCGPIARPPRPRRGRALPCRGRASGAPAPPAARRGSRGAPRRRHPPRRSRPWRSLFASSAWTWVSLASRSASCTACW